MLRIGILEPDRYPGRARAMLESVGEVRTKTDSVSLQDFLRDVNVLVIRLKYLLNREFLDQAPHLRIVCTATTGLDHIDLQLAQARGISVLSLRGETAFLRTVTATAEHTWGLLLALIRHIPHAHNAVVNGDWNRDRFFGRELQGRTLGIVGLGRIGQMVARYGLAFRMKVIAHDPLQPDWLEGVERAASLQELASSCDVLSIHVPLSKETTGLIDKNELAALKRGTIILNTSRGAVLDESALLDGLEKGHIGGAALDVFAAEPLPADDPLWEMPNVIISPHSASTADSENQKIVNLFIENLKRYIANEPMFNVLDTERYY